MMGVITTVGVILLSASMRSFNWLPLRKIGFIGYLAAIFLAGYFISGHHIWAGSLASLGCFAIPWIKLLTLTRRIRLPLKKYLQPQPPPSFHRFPELGPTTEAIEAEGFVHISDGGCVWDETREFYRFFYNSGLRLQAAICFHEQETCSWSYLTLTSRLKDGRIFRTSNEPFSSPMKSPPALTMRRVAHAADLAEFLAGHQDWLESLGITRDGLEEQDPDLLFSEIEEESGRQMAHNVRSGIIALCGQAGTGRYSWKGLALIYLHVLWDILRWC